MARYFALWFLLCGTAWAQTPPTAPTWVNPLGGFAFSDRALGVAVDSQDNFYVGGDFGATVDFDPGAGVVELTTTIVDPYLAKYDAAGDLLWVRHFQAPGAITEVAIDSNDNVIVAGIFSATLVVDGSLTLEPVSSRDLFVIKLDSAGNLVWGFSLGGNGDDIPQHLVVDSADAVLVSGTIRISADFDPGPGVTELVAGIDEDAFVAKYSSAGALLWARMFEQVAPSGLAQSESAHGLTVDGLDNVYVGGQAEGTVDFSGNLVATGGAAAYLVKYDPAGVFQWVRVTEGLNSTLRTEVFGLGADANDNLYAAGMFFGEVDFDPDPVDQVIGNSNSSLDLYLASFDSTGDLRWVKFLQGPVTQQVVDIQVRADGSSTIGGTFSGTADFDPGPDVTELSSNTSAGDCWFAHYDPAGALVSAHHLPGTPNFNGQANCTIQSIAPAADNDLAMAGQYRMAVDFDPGPPVLSLTPQTTDGFVARYGQPAPVPEQIFMNGFESP